jgi:hypothetical protein
LYVSASDATKCDSREKERKDHYRLEAGFLVDMLKPFSGMTNDEV